jgi:hypothetical protein
LDFLGTDLLQHGADPTIVDRNGNTALHYLACLGLTEVLGGERSSLLLQLLHEKDLMPMHILLDDDGGRSSLKSEQYASFVNSNEMSEAIFEEWDAEVFGLFEEAGTNWGQTDGDGNTALHIVAGQTENKRAEIWTLRIHDKNV